MNIQEANALAVIGILMFIASFPMIAEGSKDRTYSSHICALGWAILIVAIGIFFSFNKG